MVNLTDIDSHGREAYGGVTRDLKYLDEHPVVPPDHFSAGSSIHGSNPLGLAAFLLVYPAIVVAEFGLVGTELSLSWAGDTCTLPLIPAMNRLDDVIRKPGGVADKMPDNQPVWLQESNWLLAVRAPTWDTNNDKPPATASPKDVTAPEKPKGTGSPW
jgi:hypothetical protein